MNDQITQRYENEDQNSPDLDPKIVEDEEMGNIKPSDQLKKTKEEVSLDANAQNLNPI